MIYLLIYLHLGSRPYCPNAHRPYLTGPLRPMSVQGSLVTFLKFQMDPRLLLWMSSGSIKKERRYTCLCEAKASHSQRMLAEVAISAPHLLHNGMSDSPISWRCLLRILYSVRRPVRALACVLLKDRNQPWHPDKVPKLILEPVFGCHQDLTIIPNAG